MRLLWHSFSIAMVAVALAGALVAVVAVHHIYVVVFSGAGPVSLASWVPLAHSWRDNPIVMLVLSALSVAVSIAARRLALRRLAA